MQLLHHLLGIFAGHREAQVMAGCAVTNHANVERFQYAEYLLCQRRRLLTGHCQSTRPAPDLLLLPPGTVRKAPSAEIASATYRQWRLNRWYQG